MVHLAKVTAGALSGAASFSVSVASSEPEDVGDGDTVPDIVITGTGLQPRFAGWEMDSLATTGSRHQQHYAGGKLSLRQELRSEQNSRAEAPRRRGRR